MPAKTTAEKMVFSPAGKKKKDAVVSALENH
jgi:hypothetical protein